jgi:hypothetical protein
MNKPARTALLALTMLGVWGLAQAQSQDIRVRGTVTAFDGRLISIKSREGRDLQVDLPDNANVAATKAITLDDIKPGAVLGVTTVKRPDGSIVAIDVRPIPPAASLGLSAYDLQPESTMTNAALEASVASAQGRELTLNYKTGTVKVLVPPGTPMSQSVPGSRADIKPGETIFLVARPGEGGKLTALRAQVSKDGVKPTQ